MRRPRGAEAYTLLLLCVLAWHRNAGAQERPFPYRVDGSTAVLAPLGLGLSILGEGLAPPPALTLERLAGMDPMDVNGFDRRATANWSPAWASRSDRGRDLLLAAAGVVAFAPEVLSGRWGNAATMGAIFGETYLLLRGSTYTVKRLTDRPRPYLRNTALSVEERLALATSDDQGPQESFYSGHAAAAFAAAALLSTIYDDTQGRSSASTLIWASSMSVAALTAYARVAAGKHYPSDVLVGAAVGTAIGVLVPRLHRKDGAPPLVLSAAPISIRVRLPLGGW